MRRLRQSLLTGQYREKNISPQSTYPKSEDAPPDFENQIIDSKLVQAANDSNQYLKLWQDATSAMIISSKQST